MKISENYFIESDENNFKLLEIRIKGDKSKKAGDEREVVLGYYGTLENALKGYLKHKIRHDLNTEDDIESFFEKLDIIHNDIKLFCNSLDVYKSKDINL